MDAVEYIKAQRELCDTFSQSDRSCKECPMSMNNNDRGLPCGFLTTKYPEETVAIVEKWAKENEK